MTPGQPSPPSGSGPRPGAGGRGQPASPTLARSLGQFFGHLWGAVSKPPPPEPPRQVQQVRRETQETVRQTDGGPVILRRTTIEEIELPRPPSEPPR